MNHWSISSSDITLKGSNITQYELRKQIEAELQSLSSLPDEDKLLFLQLSMSEVDEVVELSKTLHILDTDYDTMYHRGDFNPKHFDYCLKRWALFYPVIDANLPGVMASLLEHKIRCKDGLILAMRDGKEEMAQYLLTHNEDGYFSLYGEYGGSILSQAIAKKMTSTISMIIEMYPEMLLYYHQFSRNTPQKEIEFYSDPSNGPEVLIDAFYGMNLEIIRILQRALLKYYGLHIDLNQYRCITSRTVLHRAIYGPDDILNGVYEKTKFAITYGAIDVPGDAQGYFPKTAEEYAQDMANDRREAYFRAVADGLGILWYDKYVMWNALKHVAEIVTKSGFGVGKNPLCRIFEYVGYLQFEEKLDIGELRLLHAQSAITLHGIVEVGNAWGGGGHVKLLDQVLGEVQFKYVTTGYDQHLWLQAEMHSGTMLKVLALGNSHVDHPLSRSGGMHAIVQYVGARQDEILQCGKAHLHVWGEDAYDQKLHAQLKWYMQTGAVLPTFGTLLHVVMHSTEHPCDIHSEMFHGGLNLTEAHGAVAVLYSTLYAVTTYVHNHIPLFLLHPLHHNADSHEHPHQAQQNHCSQQGLDGDIVQYDHSVMYHTFHPSHWL